ncbi:DUF1761 domain-containing protein [soil metagenome]
MFEIDNLNYLAIVAATLVNVILGSWWYSPAGFGKKWSKITGVNMMKSPKEETRKAIIIVFFSSIIQAVVLAVVLRSLGATHFTDGIIAGVVLWLGFVAATSIGDDLYSRRGWKFWWLNSSFFLIVMIINGVILSVW